LPAGDYTLVQTNLPGYSDVSDTGGNPLDNRIPVTLTAGASSPGNDFVDKRFGSIAGNVKEDLNNDDVGDANLAGVNVTLLDSAGAVVGSMLTGPAGNYKFVDLPPGAYIVVETNLPGYSDVSDTEGSPLDGEIAVDLSVGENSTGNNFVDERLGGISGTVLEDTNHDGTGNTPLGGVTITLWTADETVVAVTVTDSSGNYAFVDLPAGDFVVVQTNLAGYSDVSDTGGDPLDNRIPVKLAVGENSIGNNFVDERLGSVAGKVEEDSNNDDVGDTALAGVNVTLLDGAGNIVSSMLTGPNGKYKFVDLPAGNYSVIETNLAGYIDVSDTQGNPLDNTIAVILDVGEASVENNFVDEIPTVAPTQNPTPFPTPAPTAVPTALPTNAPTTSAPTTLMPSVRACVFNDNAADFVFVIDGSESILEADFTLLKDITQRLVNSIHAKSPQSTFSVVLYSSASATQFPINQNAASILPVVAGLIQPKGGTNTEAGLRDGQATFLNDGKPHTIILITDGNPAVANQTAAVSLAQTTAAADEIKASGTFIVPIGVLAAISTSVATRLTANLNVWASSPRFVFTPDDYEVLLSILDEIIGEIECI
jgi:von Willebrand factor type A domain/SdrD B-like domain